ncbi:hypothetical protein NUSPORA_01002 [Nucleospora cyclopteri]
MKNRTIKITNYIIIFISVLTISAVFLHYKGKNRSGKYLHSFLTEYKLHPKQVQPDKDINMSQSFIKKTENDAQLIIEKPISLQEYLKSVIQTGKYDEKDMKNDQKDMKDVNDDQKEQHPVKNKEKKQKPYRKVIKNDKKPVKNDRKHVKNDRKSTKERDQKSSESSSSSSDEKLEKAQEKINELENRVNELEKSTKLRKRNKPNLPNIKIDSAFMSRNYNNYLKDHLFD